MQALVVIGGYRWNSHLLDARETSVLVPDGAFDSSFKTPFDLLHLKLSLF